jgi:hypothetical protein
VRIVIASTPVGHGIMRGMQHTAGDQAYVHASGPVGAAVVGAQV